jgi:hypothetical protein
VPEAVRPVLAPAGSSLQCFRTDNLIAGQVLWCKDVTCSMHAAASSLLAAARPSTLGPLPRAPPLPFSPKGCQPLCAWRTHDLTHSNWPTMRGHA